MVWFFCEGYNSFEKTQNVVSDFTLLDNSCNNFEGRKVQASVLVMSVLVSKHNCCWADHTEPVFG